MRSKKFLDLQSAHARIIRSVLDAHVPGMEVWAFGSRVTGSARQTSDLDIVLRTDHPVDILLLAKIRDGFSASTLPMKIDVLDWSTLSSGMQASIEQEHCML